MKSLLSFLALLFSQCIPLSAAAPTSGQFLFQQKSSGGPFDQFGVTPLTGQAFGWDGTKVVMIGPGGAVSWGSIIGTLTDQIDLQSALNLKLSLAGTLPLGGFGSITGTLPIANLPGTVQLTNGTLALGGFGSITGTLADSRLSANVQLKNGTLGLAGFGSITGTIGTGNLPATIPDGNLSANVQLKNGTLGLAGFGSITGQVPAANVADLSSTYLTLSLAASSYQPLDADLTALAALSGTNNIYYRSAANTWSSVTVGSGLSFSAGSLTATNLGTVTSVALAAPAVFSVSGSPVTSTGTLTLSLANQSANRFWGGPTTGSAAAPTFRALVSGDIPDLSASYLTPAAAASAYQPLDADLTAISALSGTNSLYYRSAANTWSPVAFGSGLSFAGGTLSTSLTGTVTSVGLTAPGIFSVSGSPVTTAGSISFSLANQSANLIWAGPASGAAATPAFRSLVANDVPDLSGTYLTLSLAASSYQPLDADLTALAALSGTNNIYYRSGANTWSSVAVGSGLSFSGGSLTATNSATVTSVGLTAPGIFSVSGSPVTTSGTLGLSLATQSANTIWAGPTTGSAASPAFRGLVANDIPDLSASYLTPAAAASAYQPLDADLTTISGLSGTNNIYYRSGAAAWSNVSIGGGLSFSGGTLASTAVTSVGLTLPSVFNVTGSPVTSSGTLAATFNTQTANSFLGGPTTGSDATPTFRTLVPNDIPDISATYLTPAAAASAYQPLDADLTALAALSGTNNIYYRSAANTWSSVTVGSNLSFAGGTLAATGGTGTVTSVGLSLPSILTVAGSPVTTSGTLSATLASQIPNVIFAGPASGGSAAPTFRALTTSDVPGINSLLPTQTGHSGEVLSTNGTNTSWISVAGTGTVTSVGLSVPSFLSVSGSPVTTSGTLAVSLANQSANLVFAGPTTGSAAAPTYRSLVAADFPNTTVTPGSYTGADITVDAAGRITAAANGSGGGGGATLGANTFTGAQLISVNGAASTPPLKLNGTIFTGGTGTTTKPQFMIEPSTATTATSWSTSGTAIGINTASGFTGNLFDAKINNGNSVYTVGGTGGISTTADSTASTPAVNLRGDWFSGGTGTTTFPHVFIGAAAYGTVTSWSTSGTGLGIARASGGGGNAIDVRQSGTNRFLVTMGGNVTASGTIDSGGTITAGSGMTVTAGTLTLSSGGVSQSGSSSTNSFAGAISNSKAGALGLPSFTMTGAPITGGTATNTKPLFLLEASGATTTNWNTSGTQLGINSSSGFAGYMLDIQKNAVRQFSVDASGNVAAATGDISTETVGKTLKVKSGSNSKAGTFTLVAGVVTVSNTSVTANSVIAVTLKTVGGTRTGNPDIVPTATTGFTATGGVSDTSTYNYVILEVN